MEDLTKLTKAELLQRLQAMQTAVPSESATVAEKASPQPNLVDDVLAQNQRLVTALVAARTPQTSAAPEPTTHRVENVCGAAVGFQLTDPRTGLSRHYSLERRGAHVDLDGDRMEQLKTKYPSFFAKGYLSAPSAEADNPNVIRDIPAFIAALAYDEIIPRVAAITSIGTLQALFHHIETLRFATHDDQGRPLVEKDPVSGQDRPTIEERHLDAKAMALELAVQRRLYALSGTRASLDG
jgi:hypothetical protein